MANLLRIAHFLCSAALPPQAECQGFERHRPRPGGAPHHEQRKPAEKGSRVRVPVVLQSFEMDRRLRQGPVPTCSSWDVSLVSGVSEGPDFPTAPNGAPVWIPAHVSWPSGVASPERFGRASGPSCESAPRVSSWIAKLHDGSPGLLRPPGSEFPPEASAVRGRRPDRHRGSSRVALLPLRWNPPASLCGLRGWTPFQRPRDRRGAGFPVLGPPGVASTGSKPPDVAPLQGLVLRPRSARRVGAPRVSARRVSL